jgi:hypothetical protein
VKTHFEDLTTEDTESTEEERAVFLTCGQEKISA